MGARRAARDARRHVVRTRDLGPAPRVVVRPERRQEPDIHHLERAHERARRVEPVAALRATEGDGEVGAHRAPGDRSGVRVRAGRQVDGDHVRARVVEIAQRLHSRGDDALRDAARAGAE